MKNGNLQEVTHTVDNLVVAQKEFYQYGHLMQIYMFITFYQGLNFSDVEK